MNYEKYRGADAVIYMDDAGNVRRLDPKRVDDATDKAAQKAGFRRVEVQPDGFRKPRLSGKERRKVIAEKIASGEVADPEQGGQPHQTYDDDVFVVELPLGTMGGAGTQPED